MTYDELVTALNAAIDQPNPSPPPRMIDGSAGEGDEIPAEQLLARLVEAKDRSNGAASEVTALKAQLKEINAQYSASLERWTEWRAARFPELDRSTRAVETLILLAAPSTPVTPSTPGDPGDPDAAVLRARTAIGLGDRYGVLARAVEGLTESLRLFDQRPPAEPVVAARNLRVLLSGATSRVGSASIAYTAAADAAEQFLSYLELP